MHAVREDWLGLTAEAAIDPDLPICDPHHHLWVHRGRYLLAEFLADAAAGHRIASSVFVACDSMYRKEGPPELRPVGETEFVEGIAAGNAARQGSKTDVAAGIVGFADLALGAKVERVLEAHLAASPDRFRGIRFAVAWDEDPALRGTSPNVRAGWLLDSKFREGFACLRKLGLSFDAWLFHHQLPELASLARAFPDVSIILNHHGGPLGIGAYAAQRGEVFSVWRRGIREIAACPNVYAKLGGLGMPRMGFGWDSRPAPPTSAELAEAGAPYHLFCIEELGPERCMFESNFPSDKVSFSYVVAWNACKRIARDFSPAERRALFHDTAVRAYRLDKPR